MKNPKPFTATDVKTGVTRTIDIPPQVYTSVHDWKPIVPERFVALLHTYQTQDRNLDNFNHGLMHQTGYRLDRSTNAVIHYTVKEIDSSVSSPVLMTVTYETTGKVICFASLTYGLEADPERKLGD